MEIFAENSALDIEPMASATFAAIDVPLFKIWFDRTASFLFAFKYRDKFTILTEKLKLFSWMILYFFLLPYKALFGPKFNSGSFIS